MPNHIDPEMMEFISQTDIFCRNTATKICKTVIEDVSWGAVSSTCKCELTTYGQVLNFIQLLLYGLIILYIWMFVDCAKSKFKNQDRKTKWLILLFFLGPIASIFYLFMIKIKNKY